MSSLSLLSRGTGLVIKKKQEKLEVPFDPKDDLNWTSPETLCHVSGLLDHKQVVEKYCGLYLPKPYSTRKRAFLLHSEDLAQPFKKWNLQGEYKNKSRMLCIKLHTLQDLVQAILVYGNKQLWTDKKGIAQQPCMYFQRDSDSQTARQMRPGYSAKRYLLRLAQTWDPSVLQKLKNAGSISDPLLFEENAAYLRKKLQDLSTIPPKYNLRIFCSSCMYSQTELKKDQTYPGLGTSLCKQAKNQIRLVKGYPEQKARRPVRIPLRISVRKLNFHLKSQHTRETTWIPNEARWQISEAREVEFHQDGKIKKDQNNSEMRNQSVNFPAFGNTSTDTTDLWFNQNHLKSTDGRGRRPSRDARLFLLINSGTSEVTKKHEKQVPEVFRLPHIAEDSPRIQRKKITSSELSKKPVILPLLVQPESQTKVKKSKEACSKEPKSETDFKDKQSIPVRNDHVLDTKHRNKKPQINNAETPRVSQSSFCLPLASQEETALRERKAVKREVCTGTDSKEELGNHKSISLSSPRTSPDGEIICLSLLGSVQTTDNPRKFGFPTEGGVSGEYKLSIEVKRIAPRSPPEIFSEVYELEQKEMSIILLTCSRNDYLYKLIL